ncbi:MAG TPA: hypothetical protein VM536_17875, partial [Chloroflexia bacterium]|nr:hypothetical protein [Chloroflexia bacterium]
MRAIADDHPVRATRGRTRHLLVLLGYLLVAVAWTWPLAGHLTTAIPGDGKDGWQNAWNLWWVAQAVLQGRNPFHTDLLFHPIGADLYLHTLQPLNGLLSLPVQVLWGPVAAYNAVVLAALPLAAWGAYLLAHDRLARARSSPAGWRGAMPPLVAGLLFGFSPYLAGQLLSHLNLVSAWGLPFSTLALLRAADAVPPRPAVRSLPWVHISLAVGALVLTA